MVALGLLAAGLSGCGSNRLGGLVVRTSVTSYGQSSPTSAVAQGTEVALRISVTNVGQATVAGVTLRANVPSGFTYVGTSGSSTNGNAVRSADVNPAARDATLTWGAWTIGPRGTGHASQVLITAELRATGTPASTNFTPDVLATGFANALSGVPLDLSITPAPAIGMQLHVSPSAVAAGEQVVYRIVVTNTGSGAASQTSVGVTLPNGFDYLSTESISGDAGTGGATYPTQDSELPIWTGFDIPGQGSGGPGVLAVAFVAVVENTVARGTYDCSASVVVGTGSLTALQQLQNYSSLAPVQVTGPS